MKVPEGKTREIPDPDSYNSIIVGLIDKGTQPSRNPAFKDSRRLLVFYEISGHKTEEGDPFVLFKDYNFTDSPTGFLSEDLTPLKVEMDDITTALGKCALIEVVHSKDGKYANIKKVSALPKGTKLPKPVSAYRTLLLSKEDFDEETFNGLSDKMKAEIAGSNEYAEVISSKVKKPAAKQAAAPAKPAPGKRK